MLGGCFSGDRLFVIESVGVLVSVADFYINGYDIKTAALVFSEHCPQGITSCRRHPTEDNLIFILFKNVNKKYIKPNKNDEDFDKSKEDFDSYQNGMIMFEISQFLDDKEEQQMKLERIGHWYFNGLDYNQPDGKTSIKDFLVVYQPDIDDTQNNRVEESINDNLGFYFLSQTKLRQESKDEKGGNWRILRGSLVSEASLMSSNRYILSLNRKAVYKGRSPFAKVNGLCSTTLCVKDVKIGLIAIADAQRAAIYNTKMNTVQKIYASSMVPIESIALPHYKYTTPSLDESVADDDKISHSDVERDEFLLAFGDEIGRTTIHHMTIGDVFNTEAQNVGISSTSRWHQDKVASLAFTADNMFLLSGGKESVLVQWNVSDAGPSTSEHSVRDRFYIPRLNSTISSISTNSKSTIFYIGLENGSVAIVDAVTKQVTNLIKGLPVLKARPTEAKNSADNLLDKRILKLKPASQDASPIFVCDELGAGRETYAILKTDDSTLTFFALGSELAAKNNSSEAVYELNVSMRNKIYDSHQNLSSNQYSIKDFKVTSFKDIVTLETAVNNTECEENESIIKFWKIKWHQTSADETKDKNMRFTFEMMKVVTDYDLSQSSKLFLNSAGDIVFTADKPCQKITFYKRFYEGNWKQIYQISSGFYLSSSTLTKHILTPNSSDYQCCFSSNDTIFVVADNKHITLFNTNVGVEDSEEISFKRFYACDILLPISSFDTDLKLSSVKIYNDYILLAFQNVGIQIFDLITLTMTAFLPLESSSSLFLRRGKNYFVASKNEVYVLAFEENGLFLPHNVLRFSSVVSALQISPAGKHIIVLTEHGKIDIRTWRRYEKRPKQANDNKDKNEPVIPEKKRKANDELREDFLQATKKPKIRSRKSGSSVDVARNVSKEKNLSKTLKEISTENLPSVDALFKSMIS